jgi:hypothetical protein
MELPETKSVEFSDHDLQSLLNALELLNDGNEIKGIGEIITEMQPRAAGISGLLSVDYEHLSDATLRKIQSFVKESVEHRGLPYY